MIKSLKNGNLWSEMPQFKDATIQRCHNSEMPQLKADTSIQMKISDQIFLKISNN